MVNIAGKDRSTNEEFQSIVAVNGSGSILFDKRYPGASTLPPGRGAGPIVTDLDGDGKIDILATSANSVEDTSKRDMGAAYIRSFTLDTLFKPSSWPMFKRSNSRR